MSSPICPIKHTGVAGGWAGEHTSQVNIMFAVHMALDNLHAQQGLGTHDPRGAVSGDHSSIKENP